MVSKQVLCEAQEGTSDRTRRFDETRARLEEILDVVPPEQKAAELSLYDMMVRTIQDYCIRKDNEKKQILRDLLADRDFTKASDRLDVLEKKYRHPPAYIIGLNVNPNEPEYTIDLFNGQRRGPCIGKQIHDPAISRYLEELAYKDGAIIAGKDYVIMRVRAQLTKVNPAAILADEFPGGIPEFVKIGLLLGFYEDVNTRHLSAIAASYQMPGTVFYTLSEDTFQIRRFVAGKITFSTHPQE